MTIVISICIFLYFSFLIRLWIAWTIRNVRNRQVEGKEKMDEDGETTGESGHKAVREETQAELAWFHCFRGSDGNETSCKPGKKQGEKSWLNASNTWLPESLTERLLDGEIYVGDQELDSSSNPLVEWSDVFFDCLDQRWYIAYHGLIVEPSPRGKPNETDDETGSWYIVKGFIRADLDITKTDINQCDRPTSNDMVENDNPLVLTLVTSANEKRALEINNRDSELEEPLPIYSQYYLHHAKGEKHRQQQQQHLDTKNNVVLNLFGTHKCHNENSRVSFNKT